MDFNNQWIEIFRAGDYGSKGAYTPDDLDAMVKNFAHWQPPAVLGHPATDSPAMGWAKTIKRDGNRLLAQFEKTQPAFVDAVRDGRFPNRSVAIYKNPQGAGPAIRHIGFLGATPPEIKGLAPIQFGDGEFTAIEFQEEDAMNEPQLSKEQVGVLTSFYEKMKGMFGGAPAAAPAFDEAKIGELVGNAVKSAVEPLKAQITTLSEENKKLQESTVAAQASARVSEIRTFVEGLKQQGKWVPAMDSILPFVETAASEGRTVEFGEGDKKEKLSALEALKRHAQLIGQVVPLGEVARGVVDGKVVTIRHANGGNPVEPHSDLLAKFADELVAKDKTLDYGDALKQARQLHPELARPALAVGQA